MSDITYNQHDFTFTVPALEGPTRTDIQMAVAYDPDGNIIATFYGDYAYDHASRFATIELGVHCRIEFIERKPVTTMDRIVMAIGGMMVVGGLAAIAYLSGAR